MQSLNPTRIVQRQGRELMFLGAGVLIVGLIACLLSVLVLLVFQSNILGFIILAIGVVIVGAGVTLTVRGLTLRTENQSALAVDEALQRELDDRYTLLRNVSRRKLGYIDAVLVGPPGALVMRIIEQPGFFRNEGSDWLERDSGQTFKLSKIDATRECVTDVYALRKYLAGLNLSAVPVFGIVIFTHAQTEVTARQPAVPIAVLRTLTTVLRRDYLAEDRVDKETVERTVQGIYA